MRTALQAVGKLAERFDVPAATLQAETLLTAAREATTPTQRKAVAEAAIKLIADLAQADDYELARSVCDAARSSAQNGKEHSLARELSDKATELERGQKGFQVYRDALAVMENDPAEPEANLAAGRYLCFVKGDLDQGVPMLALGGDAELKAIAVKDLQGADSAEKQVRWVTHGGPWRKRNKATSGTR